MQIQPANVDQLLRARDGRMALIDADVGGVAAELRRIDPGLKVRFGENGNPPFWAVYWESEDQRVTELVLTVQAEQTNSGVWVGLDHRVVDRVREIDAQGRGGYDYAKELERENRRVSEERKHQFREQIGGTMEQAAHAVRKDLGLRYKGRIFKPRDLPAA